MTRPIVGIIGNTGLINDRYPVHEVGTMVCDAVAEVSGCIPMIIPPDPCWMTVAELMETCDGFLLPGGRPNVHPSEYGDEETEAHGTFDRKRDAIALELVRACVATGQPVFGICRGFQEIAVAMGSTLHPEIRELPGRRNHRMPVDVPLDEGFSNRHMVQLTPGGRFARIFGAEEVETNSLHGQGIMIPGPRIVVEGRTEDGTMEAIYVKDAPGFTMAVQWHPEHRAAQDPVSRPLFEAFGHAVRSWAMARRGAAKVA
ncbi:gamma-glutamyl-gamma-aminobutyrate hydrolase family protein [Thioclava sp. GXIMD2076]|uniref:gamma-glutamyl-gamma-aminobutyrate hydrolase family protein n=1 Tax=unclassified Thioclava TaxID=2621713 RepID=UPI0030CC6581